MITLWMREFTFFFGPFQFFFRFYDKKKYSDFMIFKLLTEKDFTIFKLLTEIDFF
jgi:hypothetical protein